MAAVHSREMREQDSELALRGPHALLKGIYWMWIMCVVLITWQADPTHSSRLPSDASTVIILFTDKNTEEHGGLEKSPEARKRQSSL